MNRKNMKTFTKIALIATAGLCTGVSWAGDQELLRIPIGRGQYTEIYRPAMELKTVALFSRGNGIGERITTTESRTELQPTVRSDAHGQQRVYFEKAE